MWVLIREDFWSGFTVFKTRYIQVKHYEGYYCDTTPGRWQSKTLILLTNVDKKKFRNCRVFNCHLSPDWQQMAIENTVSSDF